MDKWFLFIMTYHAGLLCPLPALVDYPAMRMHLIHLLLSALSLWKFFRQIATIDNIFAIEFIFSTYLFLYTL